MEIITSTQNRIVKLARSLSQRKFRTETGLFLVEGVNLLRDMPQSVALEYVIATKERLDQAKEIFRTRADAEFYCVTDAVMQSISDTAAPYGIAAVCAISETEFAMPKGNALLLDGVSDPGNLGTVLRTAAACGFCDVYALETADIYSPKVVRATLGALFRVRVYVIDEQRALELVRNTRSAILDMGGENILCERVESPVLFVAGNEAHGVRASIKEEAQRVYSLPMKNDIESLNVAVATAVAMYQTMKE